MRRFLRFARDEKGVAAVEFALTGPIFFALIMALTELGFFFFAWGSLDAGLVEAARFVRTGGIHGTAAGVQASAFKQAVCDAVLLPECETRLIVDMRAQGSFASAATMASTADAAAGNVQFTAGTPLSIMSARIFYRMPNVFAGFFFKNAREADGNVYLSAMTIFRNEPYNS
ncbi:MAG: pilus assembly protein [Geminicoccaceae bacterium]|nr:pilus assembly protein [Geminicoccaceae bacterium]